MSPFVKQRVQRICGRWAEEAARQGRDVPVWADISLPVKAQVGRRVVLSERRNGQLRPRFAGSEAERIGWTGGADTDIYEMYTPEEREVTSDAHDGMLLRPCGTLIRRELSLTQRPGQFRITRQLNHYVLNLPLDKTPGERVLIFSFAILDDFEDPHFDFAAEVGGARLREVQFVDLGYGVPQSAMSHYDIESGVGGASLRKVASFA